MTGEIRSYKKGEIVFREGEEGSEMYLIRSGKVKIYRERGGKEITLTVLTPPDFFGEMAVLTDKPRSASAIALEDTELEVISKKAFKSFVNAPLILTLLKKMGERIRETDDRLEELSLKDEAIRDHLGSLLTQKRWFV